MDLLSSLFARPLIGLDIGITGIKAVELSGGKTPRLLTYNRIPLPPGIITPEGEIKDRNKVIEGLQKLFATGFGSRSVAVGAFGNSIITKKISMPRMNEDELGDQLYWEAEQYIPFSMEEVNLDYAVIGDNSNSEASTPTMDVLLIAARKDYVNSLKSILEGAGVKVEVVDAQAFALGNVFEFSYGNAASGLHAIVDFGGGTTKLSLVENDKTAFTRDLRLSGVACTQLISEQLSIPYLEAENLKINDPQNPQVVTIIRQFIYQVVEELSRALEFAVSQSNVGALHGVYICGGGSRLDGLLPMLEEKLPVPVKPLNPIQNIAGSGKKMNAAMIRELAYLGSVAIGLALRKKGE